MSTKNDLDKKGYILNLIKYFIFVIIAILVFSVAFVDGEPSLIRGYVIVSFFAILSLGHVMARDFTKSHKKKMKRILEGKFEL